MQCFSPILIKEWINSSDGRKRRSNSFKYVPCGKCIACLQARRSQWTFRLCKESDASVLSYFVTLTYDDDHLLNNMYQYNKVVFPCFNKRDIQLYLKRLRKRLHKFCDTIQMSYLLVSEYGTKTFRPHYHALMFFKGCDVDMDRSIQDMISDSWNLSSNFPVIEPTSQGNIHYVTKYSLKDISGCFSSIYYFHVDGKEIGFSKAANTYLERPFMMCSTRPYLGSSVDFDAHISANGADCTGVYLNGVPMPVPRVMRSKHGILGKSIEQSPDPRLNLKQYQAYQRRFERGNISEVFSIWLNKQLKNKEQRALDIAARNSEKV